ncbi:phage capsid protein [Phaeobacter italicus]|jgi:hypothetical protein|uniref:phage capsid protein n=1 Tax=Phaeobacter italicus TaxID=481446 RepID=UPI002FDC8A14
MSGYQIVEQQYRDEWVLQFQRGETYLKDAVTRELVFKGDTAVFPIQGSAPRMVRRGVNGLIPSRQRTDSQVNVPLEEFHSLETQSSFNIFTSQSDLRMAMQQAGALTAAREIDQIIIDDALSTATNQFNNGNAITLTFGNVVDIISELNEQDVYSSDDITILWTPKAWARIKTFDEFTSADYVDEKPLAGGVAGKERPVRWAGATHMPHTGLPNIGGNNAQCYAFARGAVGHAVNNDMIHVNVGYDGEQDYSYARHTIFQGARLLQQPGVLQIIHDDTQAIA